MATLEGLSGSFASRLQALAAAVAAQGGHLGWKSGFRPPEQQAGMFARAVQKYGSEAAARKWVAPPGKSNHGKGIAMDLDGDLELAHRLAPQFGLYFPMEWEPWHIEPIGSRDGSYHDGSAYTTPPEGSGMMPAMPRPRTFEDQLVDAAGILAGGVDDSDLTAPVNPQLVSSDDGMMTIPGAQENHAPGELAPAAP